ncbi:hypothetical protein L917_08756 [Phytophthora nicotianae]|uniref:Uncharacterized protein n=1 Tax=Phytophthora nicotianae TaxID=4792 RepID=W2L8N0_PHYNI|nr:hypothetical protein L915_08917 [Phytophthora nicotianae]ETL39867.1 hypothetical protein L916_08836 [Phytophthora nicotianae]ETL92995.1 hypothetical protein L917_08756 [Phytophthora nicotianae]
MSVIPTPTTCRAARVLLRLPHLHRNNRQRLRRLRRQCRQQQHQHRPRPWGLHWYNLLHGLKWRLLCPLSKMGFNAMGTSSRPSAHTRVTTPQPIMAALRATTDSVRGYTAASKRTSSGSGEVNDATNMWFAENALAATAIALIATVLQQPQGSTVNQGVHRNVRLECNIS